MNKNCYICRQFKRLNLRKMQVAIYGINFDEPFSEAIYKIFEKLNRHKIKIFIYKPFFEFIEQNLFFTPRVDGFFTGHDDLDEKTDFVLSIGGDGTFLKTVAIVRKKNIPMLGINSGRLGFLAYISKEKLNVVIDQIVQNKYTIEERTLIEVRAKNKIFGNFPYGLNEITVQKKDSSSMISVDVFLNDDYLNTYWADGLIASTPTGSTAYSLSVGGPIVAPGSENFVLTPIAPHNLTVRPIVVPDTGVIKLRVKSRNESFLAALDFRSEVVNANCEITIKKADFKIKMIRPNAINFYTTLRNKLLWGLDKRN